MRDPIYRKFTLDECTGITSIRKEILDDMQKAISDVDRQHRLDKALCKLCFYLHYGRIGGSSSTEVLCGECKTLMKFGSTAVDRLCLSCAKKFFTCKRCGADLDYKFRKKLERSNG